MIGIDIVTVERFKKIPESEFSLWKKTFTEKEWQYCFSKSSSALHLAGIFAAKEAVMKAVGGDKMGRFDHIEITHTKEGKPEAFVQDQKKNVAVSISHDGGFAVAIAIVDQ